MSKVFNFEEQPFEAYSEFDEEETEFVRWVQNSLNQVLGLRLPVTGIMNAVTRCAGFRNGMDSRQMASLGRKPSGH